MPLEPANDIDPVVAKSIGPTQPAHPDRQLYGQVRDLVRVQGKQHGRQWGQASERLTASLLTLSKEAGLTRVDHVVFSARTDRVAAGENVFVVQGRLDDPVYVRTHMKTEKATRIPESASFAKVEALKERTVGQAPNPVQVRCRMIWSEGDRSAVSPCGRAMASGQMARYAATRLARCTQP